MYEAFYGLRERPFNLTPDPRYLYLSEKHKEAFAHLLYGIKNKSGFVLVTGEIGTGKTTICRTLLNRLDPDTEVSFVFNPRLSPQELLRSINEDFGIATHAETTRGLIDELNTYLLDRFAKGKNCVLVIDEAQNLEPAVLEQIRLLSNLETETQKLLQIVLIGQPELIRNLSLPELRQLNQRITARYHLRELDERETLQYAAYRLRVAGGRKKVRFTPKAVRELYRASSGTPRVINALCDRALLIGYTQETREISKKIIQRAAREIRGEVYREKKPSVLRRYLPSPTLIAAAVLIVLFGKYVAAPFAENLRFVVQPAANPVAMEPIEEENAGAMEQPKPVEVRPTMTSSLTAEAAVRKPLVPSLVAGFVDSLEPAVARNAAAVGILRAWNMALLGDYPADDSMESWQSFAADNGLVCTPLTATIGQLKTIGLPAVVRLMGDNKTAWAGLLGLTDDSVVLTQTVTGSRELPLKDFEERYLNQAVILWRDPDPDAEVLREGLDGGDVSELQRLLKAMDRFPPEPTGYFGSETKSAIVALQHDAGLKADGIVGQQTRMVLAGWHEALEAPRLQATTVERSEVASKDAAVDDVIDSTDAGEPVDDAAPHAVEEKSALPPETIGTIPDVLQLIPDLSPVPRAATEGSHRKLPG